MLPHSVKFIILAPLAGKKMPHARAAAIGTSTQSYLRKKLSVTRKMSWGTQRDGYSRGMKKRQGGLGFIAEAPLPYFTEQKPWREPDGPRSHH
jgi:hypothetical protein